MTSKKIDLNPSVRKYFWNYLETWVRWSSMRDKNNNRRVWKWRTTPMRNQSKKNRKNKILKKKSRTLRISSKSWKGPRSRAILRELLIFWLIKKRARILALPKDRKIHPVRVLSSKTQKQQEKITALVVSNLFLTLKKRLSLWRKNYSIQTGKNLKLLKLKKKKVFQRYRNPWRSLKSCLKITF